MKKLGINLIIGFILSGILIVLALLFVKPNYYLTMLKKDGSNNTVYVSKNGKVFSNENDVITYTKQGETMTVDIVFNKDKADEQTNKMVLFTKGEDKGRLVMSLEGKIFEAKYDKGSVSLEGLEMDEMMLCLKYVTLLTTESEDVTSQKVLCSILGVFIAFILSFLAYPAILYEKLKETKNLAIVSVCITVVLCVCSGFYIYFTLK